jgi:hypothetical protein
LFGFLQRRRDRKADIAAAADNFLDLYGAQARYRAIAAAQATREGGLSEPGRDERFWWFVVREIDRRTGHRHVDTATRYLQER